MCGDQSSVCVGVYSTERLINWSSMPVHCVTTIIAVPCANTVVPIQALLIVLCVCTLYLINKTSLWVIVNMS